MFIGLACGVLGKAELATGSCLGLASPFVSLHTGACEPEAAGLKSQRALKKYTRAGAGDVRFSNRSPFFSLSSLSSLVSRLSCLALLLPSPPFPFFCLLYGRCLPPPLLLFISSGGGSPRRGTAPSAGPPSLGA